MRGVARDAGTDHGDGCDQEDQENGFGHLH
jgi:hypothetical protein